MMSSPRNNELILRLTSVRRRVRRRLAAYGLFAVLGGGALAFLTILTLDWALWLPGPLRALGLLLFIAGFFGATLHWIVRPLRVRIGLEEIAGRLERHFAPLGDQLSSSVNFLGGAEGASPEMVQEVIGDTERRIRDLPLESALRVEPVAVRGSLFGVSMVVVLSLMVIAPQWIRTGIDRYAAPWGPTEWPRRVQIVPITGDQVVPLGESAGVAMRVARGLVGNLRGLVYVRAADGSVQAITLDRDEEGTFYATLDAVTTDMEYWFSAGDDDTERKPARITAVPRPEVAEIAARIRPPDYADQGVSRTFDLAHEAASAVVGSEITVTLRPSKALPDPFHSGARMILNESEAIPLQIDPSNTGRLTGQLRLTEDVSFRVELRDEHGFQNRAPSKYRIAARPDAPPSVSILHPPSLLELTPQATVELQAHAEDDLGIGEVRLEATRDGGGARTEIDLSQVMQLRRGEEGVSASVSHTWDLSTLALRSGDVVDYEFIVRDNFADEVTNGQVGRSGSQQLRIISAAEFELRVREDLNALEARIRQVAQDQDELRGRVDALARTMDATAGLSALQLSLVSAVESAQARLGVQLRELASRFDELARRMEQNRSGDSEAWERMRQSGDSVRLIAAGPMTEAGAALARSRDDAEPAVQRAALEDGGLQQDSAAEGLRALLRNVNRWSTFQGLVTKTRDLLERQTGLQRSTSQFGQKSMGKSADALTEPDATELGRLAREQEELGLDVDQHLARMGELADATREKQPATADSIDAAVRAARASQVHEKLRSASKALSENRTGAAGLEQRNAADGLRKMVQALREREQRELEELRKKLDGGEEQVSWLIEFQETIKTATAEAGGVAASAEVFASLESQQRTLARNTATVAAEFEGNERTSTAAAAVRQAVEPMELAALRLADSLASPAIDSQTEALQHLQEALRLLEELSQAAADLAIRQSLERFQDGLEAVLTAQLAVNDGILALEPVVRERGPNGRVESRQATKLAREQNETAEQLEELRKDLTDVPVYEWGLTRASAWMDQSSEALELRQIDASLIELTGRIAAQLQQLLAAIAETLALPMETEFAEAESGSGGSSGATAGGGAAIPPVAELLVLKAMQLEINERTRQAAQIAAVQSSGDPDHQVQNAGAEAIKNLAGIAEDQAEIRRLADLVTRKAKAQSLPKP